MLFAGLETARPKIQSTGFRWFGNHNASVGGKTYPMQKARPMQEARFNLDQERNKYSRRHPERAIFLFL
jgi:hypothetical protein